MDKKISLAAFLTLLSTFALAQQENSVAVHLKAKEKQKMPLLLAYIGIQKDAAFKIVNSVKDTLALHNYASEGFRVTVECFEAVPKKETIKQFAKRGYPLVVFITNDQQKKALDYRVYDTYSVTMICGKRIHTQNYSHVMCANLLADGLWKDLTNKPAVFSTQIAYCKEEKQNGKAIKNIYVSQPFGAAAQQAHCFLKGGRLLAPRWNHDTENPLLLFSRCTNKNVCLHSATMDKQCTLVSNFDGLNMLPAFSPDGEKVVYCLSLEGRAQLYSCEYDQKENRRILRRITNNAGNNISPSVADNGDIIFCSDFKSGRPEIFYYHHEKKQYERIAEGFCSSPQWCERTNSIAYSKAIKGVMQLFVYDTKTKKHKQITFDAGDKEESSWSPCGNYLAYCVDTKKQSRIAVMNIATHEYTFITAASERCSYPSWSPWYDEPLVIL